MLYEVIITRTEKISFVLEATDADDATDRYLADGEETASTTTALTVLSASPAEFSGSIVSDPAVVAAATLSNTALVEAAGEAKATTTTTESHYVGRIRF